MPAGDFFEQYFDYAGKTEAPTLYHRWCCLAMLGALLGRNFGLPFGTKVIYPNQYIMLLGSPGTRKDTAMGYAKLLLKAIGYNTFASDRTTKEKFLIDLAGEENAVHKEQGITEAFLFGEKADISSLPPKEMLIFKGEFNDFLGAGNIDFLSFLGTMWDYEGVYENRVKNGSSVAIPNPTISILAGNTPTGFTQAFPPDSIGQGFLSRLILIYGEPTGIKITVPPTPPPEKVAQLAEHLKAIKQKITGNASFSESGYKLLDAIYQNWQDMDDLRFKTYGTRRLTHLIKLILLTAASNLRTEILEGDVFYANSILTYTETLMPKALGEFGKSKHSDTASKVMEVLDHNVGKPLKIKDIWKLVGNDFDKYADLASLIGRLSEADKIIYHDGGVLSKRGVLKPKDQYYDFSLLREARDKI